MHGETVKFSVSFIFLILLPTFIPLFISFRVSCHRSTSDIRLRTWIRG